MLKRIARYTSVLLMLLVTVGVSDAGSLEASGAAGPTTVEGSITMDVAVAVKVASTTFTVNSEADAPDSDPGDGECLTDDNECTLRAAIRETNALPGWDSIYVPAGIYTLAIPGTLEDAAATGDFDITDDVTIIGEEAPTTIIDGNGNDRVFHIVGPVTVELANMTIQHGEADSGAGIRNDSGALHITYSSITRNWVSDTGGGIYNSGGGIYNSGLLMLDNSTVSYNTAPSLGGGIENCYGTVELTNSTVTGNEAGSFGGGIHNSTPSHMGGGGVELTNCTVSDNEASFGGGIYNFVGTVKLTNSIVANNTADIGSGDCSGNPATSNGHNLDGDGTCGLTAEGDLPSTDPLLGPLQDNGGPTFTQALLAGSPAIDGGNPAGCTDPRGNPLTTDQRGFARFGRCDMGAYEAQSIKTVNRSAALPGDPLTYTIAFQNGSVSIANFRITDTLPISVTYISSSLTATRGSYGYDSGVITWTGSVEAVEAVTITFGAAVSQTVPLGTSISNSAVISGGGEIITRAATVDVVARVFLPIILRHY